MNANESIKLIRIGLTRVGIGIVPFVNVFGTPDTSYEIVDTDSPYLLWEDGSPMLWEDGKNVLLEQQKQKKWLKEARR